MRELVVSGKRELQGNAESLDSHDRDRANRGADGQENERVLLSMDGGNLVYHDDRVYGHGNRIK